MYKLKIYRYEDNEIYEKEFSSKEKLENHLMEMFWGEIGERDEITIEKDNKEIDFGFKLCIEERWNMIIEDRNLEIETDNKLVQGEEIRKIIQHPKGRYALLTNFRVIPIDILSMRVKR